MTELQVGPVFAKGYPRLVPQPAATAADAWQAAVLVAPVAVALFVAVAADLMMVALGLIVTRVVKWPALRLARGLERSEMAGYLA